LEAGSISARVVKVGGHREDAKGKCRLRRVGARGLFGFGLVTPPSGPHDPGNEQQQQAESEVERGVEAWLGRKRDRASEDHEGEHDDQQGQDAAGRETQPGALTAGAGEQQVCSVSRTGLTDAARPSG
jgi:hypothetical protein